MAVSSKIINKIPSMHHDLSNTKLNKEKMYINFYFSYHSAIMYNHNVDNKNPAKQIFNEFTSVIAI